MSDGVSRRDPKPEEADMNEDALRGRAEYAIRAGYRVTVEAQTMLRLLTERDEAAALLSEAFNVIDSIHARAYERDVLPADHGTVTYCYACEFAVKLGRFLGKTLNYDCPAATR